MREVSILLSVLMFLYLFLGVILMFFTFLKKRNEIYYLSVAFLLRSALYIVGAFMLFNLNIEYSVWITGPIKVSLIPITYLFVKKLFEYNKSLKRNELWHFLPLIMDCILTFYIASRHASDVTNGSSLNAKQAFGTIWEENFYYTLLSSVARSIAFIQSIYYSILLLPFIRKILNYRKDNHSKINFSFFKWLNAVIVIFLVIGIFEGLAIFGVYKNTWVFILWFVVLVGNAFFFFLFIILFSENEFVLTKQVLLFRNDAESKSENKDYHGWLEFFIQKKLYTEPGLTLKKVSDELKIPTYKLTNLIKSEGYSNFYCFVNYYRVENCKSLLVNIPENHSLESVINETGFNSRATFFRVFKELTGETPNEFIKKRNNN